MHKQLDIPVNMLLLLVNQISSTYQDTINRVYTDSS